VVCGLPLAKRDTKTLTIGCGLVLDRCGCEIFVPTEVAVQVPQPSSDPAADCPPPPPGQLICYRIRIAFTDEDTDYQQLQLPGGSCGDKTCRPFRKREGFCIDLHRCDCLPARTPFNCDDPGSDVDFVQCACGCECAPPGDAYWVNIGTVQVQDGTIQGDPTYECREYVISGQMLKQILTKPNAATGEFACSDQFERLKEILGLICKSRKLGQNVERATRSYLEEESEQRRRQVSELDEALRREAYQAREVAIRFDERFEALENRNSSPSQKELLTRIGALEAAVIKAGRPRGPKAATAPPEPAEP